VIILFFLHHSLLIRTDINSLSITEFENFRKIIEVWKKAIEAIDQKLIFKYWGNVLETILINTLNTDNLKIKILDEVSLFVFYVIVF
jgi:hypothetical protein